jgi:DDE family transposase
MIMVTDSAKRLKGFLSSLPLSDFAKAMALRMVLAFVMRRGRMSCSQASVAVQCQPLDRSQVTRFLVRPRWKREDFNDPARKRLLMLEQRRGPFVFVIDATLVGQAGKTTENTYSTGDKSRGKRKKGKRYHKYKHARRSCHSFTFGVLITPSGYRIPVQIPHYTKEYCESHGVTHRTTAEAAAAMIEALETPKNAEVYVLGDTAYDAAVVQQACARKNYYWVTPANPERVYDGPSGRRPKVRDRLKNMSRLKSQQLRIRASEGKFAEHRRLSRWRVGPKLKPRTYCVYQETCAVKSVGRVKLVFSTTNENLRQAKPDELKILMTNAIHLSPKAIVDLYSCRWQIELFFKELKSRLGFDQYRLHEFEAVRGWVELAVTTVLLLETMRAEHLTNRRLNKQEKEWWRVQRLHGLCEAFVQETEAHELKFLAERLKTKGGIAKLKSLLRNGSPKEYRVGA